jgi:tol-pal system protein YbgF
MIGFRMRNLGLSGSTRRAQARGLVVAVSLFGATLVGASTSFAQDSDRIEALNARLDWIEQALIELQTDSNMSDGNGGGQPMRMFGEEEVSDSSGDPAVSRALTRIDGLEAQIRELTNQLEQLTFKIEQANRELASVAKDSDFRLQSLEQGRGMPPARSAQVAQAPEEQILGTIPDTATLDDAGNYQDDYDGALSHLRRGEHDNAEQALRLFLDNHGDSDLAGNAQYWLGESYYVRKMWRPAAQSFLICVQKYKEGLKAPDCMLKLGMSLSAMDETTKACKTLSEIARRFPNASQTILQRARSERQRNSCS